MAASNDYDDFTFSASEDEEVEISISKVSLEEEEETEAEFLERMEEQEIENKKLKEGNAQASHYINARFGGFENMISSAQSHKKNKPSKRSPPAKGINVKNGYTTSERFNLAAATKLIKYNHLFKGEFIKVSAKKTDLDPFVTLKNYVSNSTKGKIKVTYTQRKNRGRFFADHACSLQSLSKRIRGTIAGDYYYDIDMVNCHPMIFKKLCEDAGLDATYLSSLCYEREKIFKQLIDVTPGSDRSSVKAGLLSIINGGTKFYKEVKDHVLRSGNKWLKNFFVEVRQNIRELCKLNPELFDEMVAAKKDRPHSSTVNILFCIEENKLLNIMIDYFRSVEIIGDVNNFVNCFDGLMIEKEKCKKEIKLVEHLKKIEALFIEAGHNVKLAVKPFEQINLFIDEKEQNETEKNRTINEILLGDAQNCFDRDESYLFIHFFNKFREQSFSSYDEMLDEVLPLASKVVARVLTGKGFYIKKVENGVDMTADLGLSDFKMYYPTEKGVKWERLSSFLNLYPSYGSTVFKLNPEAVPSTSFNLWRGFAAQRVNLLEISNETREGLELMKTYIMETFASNSAEYYKFIVSWLAGLVTKLDEINRVALVLVSDQRTGKGTLISFMRYILGKSAVADILGLDSVVQKHNTVLQGKILINVNEISSAQDSFKSSFNKMKGLISDETMQIEPKGVGMFEVDNRTNWIFSSNHRNCMIIEQSDARHAIFEVSNIHQNDVPYFTMLRKKCFNQDVANAFYTYLLDYDALPSLENNIPRTELRESMIKQSLPSPIKFIEYVAETKKIENGTWMPAADIYDSYKTWCYDNGERCMSNTNFGVHVSTKWEKKRSNGIKYKVTYKHVVDDEEDENKEN